VRDGLCSFGNLRAVYYGDKRNVATPVPRLRTAFCKHLFLIALVLRTAFCKHLFPIALVLITAFCKHLFPIALVLITAFCKNIINIEKF
jgi:hypothetical protein